MSDLTVSPAPSARPPADGAGPERGAGPARRARASRWARAAAPWAIVALGVLLACWGQVSLRAKGTSPRLALAALGIAIAVTAVGSLAGSRWWRSRPVWAWLATWAALAASAALTWRGLPVGEKPEPGQIRAIVSARDEVALLAASAVAGSALVALSRGTRRGVLGLRWMWLAVLAATAPIALWEIRTDQHVAMSRWGEGVWNFAAHTPAATFTNPNNYACVLVAVVGTLLAWSLDRISGWASVALLGAAAFGAWLTWVTLSRGAFAAIALQVLIAGVGLAARLGVAGRLRTSRVARLIAAGAALLVVAAAVAAFVVPSLAARNPLLRAPKAGEDAADATRVELVRAGLRYWRSSPWVGTGPGTYEYHLTREKPPGVADPTLNPHNAFVEILSQYGLLGSLGLIVLLGLLCWYVVSPGRAPGRTVGAPAGSASASAGSGSGSAGATSLPAPAHVISLRVELACLLIAFAVTAIVVSSALALPMWCVMLAHATCLAWALERAGRRRLKRRLPRSLPSARRPA